MRNLPKVIALAAVAACASAYSAEQTAINGKISGFGTIGVVHADTDEADFMLPNQQRGSGKTRSVSGEVDSKLGIQGTISYGETLSATAQVTSRQTPGTGRWTPQLTWAFAKAKFEDGFSLRVGRIGSPFFMISDFRDIGYSSLTVRPPIEVYGQITGLDSLDGGDVLWKHEFGESTVNAQLFVGSSKADSVDHSKVTLKRLTGFNVSFENGPFTVRLGHVQGRLSLIGHAPTNALFDALRAASQAPLPGVAGMKDLADQLALVDKKATFQGLGVTYDSGNLVASGEYTRRRSESFAADTTGWYALAGYRFGKLTPFITYAKNKRDDANAVNTVPTFPNVPGLEGFSLLRGAVDTLLNVQNTGQTTPGLGLRWDPVRNVALKAQWERVRVDEGAVGFFSHAVTINQRPINVYSVAVDFVW